MDFVYQHRQPSPPLDRYIESIWYARGQIPYRRERIAPTGSTVAVLVLGAPIIATSEDGRGVPLVADSGFLIGPHDQPTMNEPTAETHAMGIISTPVGCRTTFDVAPASLRGRVVPLLPVWTPAFALRDELLAGIERSGPDPRAFDAAAGLAAVERALADDMRRRRVDERLGDAIDQSERVVAILEADPMRRIGDIAAEVGISHSQLDGELARIVGLTPRVLARILRLRRLLADIDVFDAINWSHLAAEYGWFDQSHFIRDFKRHTGVTPSAYVAAQLEQFGPADAEPGFVPET